MEEGGRRVRERNVTKEAEAEAMQCLFCRQGRGHQPRNTGSLKEQGAGQGQKMDSPLEPPEGTSHVDTLILTQRHSFWTSNLHNYKKINLYSWSSLLEQQLEIILTERPGPR